ncbi:MAG: hypothetical protein R3E18_02115 [Sphingomonadaceae bacterium]|nr:hypothetical protein [Sphingomonadaceae bacterium]
MTTFAKALCLAALACISGFSAPAMAEVIPVSGIYPAQNDDAIGVNTIAIENFGGEMGTSLSFAVSDALRNVVIERERWFEVVPVTGGTIAPDAVMRGTVNTEAERVRVKDRVKTECVSEDKDGKCLKEEDVTYWCRTLTVTFRPEVRLIAETGELLAVMDRVSTRSATYCQDDKNRPSEDAMTREMIAEFADNARRELAPVAVRETVRVLEVRDGVRKEDQKALKAAIKLTKRDIAGACRAFAALEAGNPASPSVLFNIGLCAERQGDLEMASSYYSRALQVDARKPHVSQGLDRLAARRRAEQQLAVHFGG